MPLIWTSIQDSQAALAQLLHAGGPILTVIIVLVFILWTVLFDRLWYLLVQHPSVCRNIADKWYARSDRKSWYAHAIRRKTLSQCQLNIHRHRLLIKMLIVLCPLTGLLGTVTGMIDVFNAMALSGGSDVRAMAAGVSKATIPTMAGMVGALSGIFGSHYVGRIAAREHELLEDSLLTSSDYA